MLFIVRRPRSSIGEIAYELGISSVRTRGMLDRLRHSHMIDRSSGSYVATSDGVLALVHALGRE